MTTKTQETANDQVDLTDAYTPDDVARILNVKVKTLAGWRSAMTPNKPPWVNLSPRAVLYPRKQFNDWMNRQHLVDPNAV